MTASALGGQFGYVSETTPGTAVTVDKFLPVTNVGIMNDVDRIEDEGIRAGRLVISHWKAGSETVSGTVETSLWNADVATLFKHMFGSVATAGAGPFTHTYTPSDLNGLAMTMQAGKPDIDGTVRPFTWAGCKIGGWTLSASAGEKAALSLDVVGMSEVTSTALATASYDSGLEMFVFTEGSLTVAGSPVSTVKSIELVADNALTDRPRLGSSQSLEYKQNGFKAYTGTVTTDFESLTQYNRYINADEVAMVLTFDNGTDTLTVTMNVRFDGGSPELSGAELLEEPIEFKCVSATSDAAAITAELVNGESTAA